MGDTLAEGRETGIKALIQDNLEEKVPTERISRETEKAFFIVRKRSKRKDKNVWKLKSDNSVVWMWMTGYSS